MHRFHEPDRSQTRSLFWAQPRDRFSAYYFRLSLEFQVAITLESSQPTKGNQQLSLESGSLTAVELHLA